MKIKVVDTEGMIKDLSEEIMLKILMENNYNIEKTFEKIKE